MKLQELRDALAEFPEMGLGVLAKEQGEKFQYTVVEVENNYSRAVLVLRKLPPFAEVKGRIAERLATWVIDNNDLFFVGFEDPKRRVVVKKELVAQIVKELEELP